MCPGGMGRLDGEQEAEEMGEGGVWKRIMDALVDEGYGKGVIEMEELSIDSSTVAARKEGNSSAMTVTTGRRARRSTSR